MAPALRTFGARCPPQPAGRNKQMTAANQAWTALVLQGKIWQGGLGQYCCPNVAALGPGSRRGNGDRRRPTGAATARPEALPLLANGWVANRGGLCGAADEAGTPGSDGAPAEAGHDGRAQETQDGRAQATQEEEWRRQRRSAVAHDRRPGRAARAWPLRSGARQRQLRRRLHRQYQGREVAPDRRGRSEDPVQSRASRRHRRRPAHGRRRRHSGADPAQVLRQGNRQARLHAAGAGRIRRRPIVHAASTPTGGRSSATSMPT